MLEVLRLLRRPLSQSEVQGEMPSPLPKVELLLYFEEKQSVLASSVGKGRFGEIYLAAPEISHAATSSFLL